MKDQLQTGTLKIEFSNVVLRQITPGEKGKFYVAGREVALTHPSPPIDYQLSLLPDASNEPQDGFSSRQAIEAIVTECAKVNRMYLGKNRGFIVWGSRREEHSQHLPAIDDYMQKEDVHVARVQFFKYTAKREDK